MMACISLLLIGSCSAASRRLGEGDGATQTAKLVASDAALVDRFGQSISISSDIMVVGADWDDDGGSKSGSAYVFAQSGGEWTQTAKLVASDAAEDDRFGRDVSISGKTIVVGTDSDDDDGRNSGSAYVFTQSGGVWAQTAKLVASDAAEDDYFGYNVAISGDTIVIGSDWDDDEGSNSGSAYVFAQSGGAWTQTAKLVASDADSSDRFGWGVAVSGETLVVGAWADEDGGYNGGSAYVFALSAGAWTQTAKLLASDVGVFEGFGSTVSISGNIIVVGAFRNYFDYDDDGYTKGAAYVFEKSGTTWPQTARLVASDQASYDGFGNVVSISGNTTVVGSAYHGFDSIGSAYLFAKSGGAWTQTAKLVASDAASFEYFGNTVAIDGDTVGVGAHGNDAHQIDDPVINPDEDGSNGSAYVFKIDQGPAPSFAPSYAPSYAPSQYALSYAPSWVRAYAPSYVPTPLAA